jgi:hypothetical protein
MTTTLDTSNIMECDKRATFPKAHAKEHLDVLESLLKTLGKDITARDLGRLILLTLQRLNGLPESDFENDYNDSQLDDDYCRQQGLRTMQERYEAGDLHLVYPTYKHPTMFRDGALTWTKMNDTSISLHKWEGVVHYDNLNFSWNDDKIWGGDTFVESVKRALQALIGPQPHSSVNASWIHVVPDEEDT